MIKMLKKLFNIDISFSLEEEFHYIVRACCIVHIILTIVFFSAGVYPLGIFNVCSVCLYLFLHRLVTAGYPFVALNIAYMEIALHTALCSILIGNDFGFHFYIVAEIPISFFIVFSLKRRRSLIYPTLSALVSFILFCAVYVYSLYHDVMYPDISRTMTTCIFLFNSLIAFVVLVFCSLLFILQILDSLKKIETQNEQLTQYACVDPLTGLLNRRKFINDLSDLAQKGEEFCILLSDVDDFKKVNDTYGHDCGDHILTYISNVYQNIVGQPNMVCRWGGEEIIVLYLGSIEQGAAIGELLRATIDNSSIDYNGQKIHITISTGVAYYDSSVSFDEVIIRADHELYESKSCGKNLVRVYRENNGA